jgi:hypothetical protein
MLAIFLILGGAFLLMHGGFSYTKDSQQAKLGPLELTIRETKRVSIPIWAGVATIAIGASLMFVRR